MIGLLCSKFCAEVEDVKRARSTTIAVSRFVAFPCNSSHVSTISSQSDCGALRPRLAFCSAASRNHETGSGGDQ